MGSYWERREHRRYGNWGLLGIPRVAGLGRAGVLCSRMQAKPGGHWQAPEPGDGWNSPVLHRAGRAAPGGQGVALGIGQRADL